MIRCKTSPRGTYAAGGCLSIRAKTFQFVFPQKDTAAGCCQYFIFLQKAAFIGQCFYCTMIIDILHGSWYGNYIQRSTSDDPLALLFYFHEPEGGIMKNDLWTFPPGSCRLFRSCGFRRKQIPPAFLSCSTSWLSGSAQTPGSLRIIWGKRFFVSRCRCSTCPAPPCRTG